MAGGTDGPHTPLLQKLNNNVLTYRPGRSIFKVPDHLRRLSKQAYEPQVISIGPYHHGKGQLEKMEVYKMFYLKRLLGRRTEINRESSLESSLKSYWTELKNMEEEARTFYSEPFGEEKFVEMMLLDGCFIVELIRANTMGSENDHFLTDFILRLVMCDLLLVENQLPFSILLHLFSKSERPNDEEMAMDEAKNFINMAISFFSEFFSEIMPGYPRSSENEDITHLLGVLHDSCGQPSSDRQEDPSSHSPGKDNETKSLCKFDIRSQCPMAKLNCCSSAVLRQSPSSRREELDSREWRFIRSATELSEAGINFKKTKGKLFDITFENGVLLIPTLRIEDDTEIILRNLVAYEQYFEDASSKCFTNYIAFMDCLINTWKDVELLHHRGVIDNWLGDHEVVAAMFNKLCDYVTISKGDFSHAETFKKLNKHCDRKCNHWMAKLWHNYFNTPWGGISIFAAVFLLLLTLLQSVYSVLSYHFK